MANTTTEAAGAATEVAGQAADAAGHATQSVGLPQLDYTTYANQIFWLVVALVLIYFVLSRVAMPRISGILADRQGKITSDIAAAEELKLKAEAAEKAYNQALVDARTEANKIVAEARAEIQKDLDRATAKADAEIAAKASESVKRIEEIRAGAAENVAIVARDTAEAIVAALGGKAEAKAVSDAVASRLKG